MQKHYLLRSHTFSFWCVLLLPLFISGSVLAQTGTSSVRGTIQDPQGSAIAGATVTLTSIETNAARTQKTSDSGVYAFELIPPGEYRVEAEASGFKKALVNALDSSTTRATVHDGFQLHTLEVNGRRFGFADLRRLRLGLHPQPAPAERQLLNLRLRRAPYHQLKFGMANSHRARADVSE
ncbi:MAG: carboxypeptidase-like regulatory domain-containing protein [Pyrinomonadaceae bacterium]